MCNLLIQQNTKNISLLTKLIFTIDKISEKKLLIIFNNSIIIPYKIIICFMLTIVDYF